ncbi:MAG TPA: alpha/beta fold hydrolase [Acidimicrobiales bacterium]|nr:alpha/beta fold hydrolase [Acidimicrobiales bacterium]
MPPQARAAPLHVRESGQGKRVILVHGFTQSSRSWAGIAEDLEQDHQVVVPDLPGHGESPRASGDLARAADQLAESCGKGTYIGYSLGGRICLHLALRRPILVERLVLIGVTAGIEDSGARADRQRADDAVADHLAQGGDAGLGRFIEEWLAGPLFAHLSEREADRPSRLVNHAAELAGALRHFGLGTQLPLWEQARGLHMPVVVVAGDRDEKFVALGERLASSIGANALFLLVPGAGHAVPFEQPEPFATLIRSFVAGGVWPPPGRG